MESRIKELSREEREIHVTKTDAEAFFTIWVSSPVWIARLKRRGWTAEPVDAFGVQFTLPVKALTFRSRKAVESKSTRAGFPSKRVDVPEHVHDRDRAL